MGDKLKLKVTASNVEALGMAYDRAMREMGEDTGMTAMERVLRAYAMRMNDTLLELHNKGQEKYTLTMVELDVLLFFAFWEQSFALDVFESNGVNKIFELIDKQKHKWLKLRKRSWR